MENVEIKDLSINIDTNKLLNMVSSKIDFLIDYKGNIINQSDTTNDIIIFKSENLTNISLLDTKSLILNIFKSIYKPVINGDVCTIKPLGNWQNIINLNKEVMLYFDHQSDGIELFEDKTLEEYGWHASALDITYREISSFIEDNCEGTFVYYDNGVTFNGFVVVEDIIKVRALVKDFILKRINELNDSLEIEDEDVIEALDFFKNKD